MCGTGRPVAESGPTLADRVVPGLRAVRRGEAGAGVAVLALWAGLLALAGARAGRIAATVSGGGPDEWLALVTLAGVLAWCWLRGTRARPLVGDAGDRGVLAELAGTPSGRRGLLLVAGVVLAALLAPYLAPHDPVRQIDPVGGAHLPPGPGHPLGTDRLGRDVLSRVLFGARVTLAAAVPAVAVSVTLGAAVGGVAGYVGGLLDSVSMRGVDLLLAFPRIVLLVAAAALFEPSLALVILLLGLTGWMDVARLVRGEVLSIRERPYVKAAEGLDLGPGRVLGRHVLPNAAGPLLVAATLGVADAALAEATLSFLGLGVQPPTPSLGSMVAGGRGALLGAWWVVVFPGAVLTAVVLGFNLLGEAARAEAAGDRRVRRGRAAADPGPDATGEVHG